MKNAFKQYRSDTGIVHLVFDLHGEKVNKFTLEVMKELDQVLIDLANSRNIRGLVIESAKENIFIAGADIAELATIKEASDGIEKSQYGQQVFNRLEDLKFPTIAVIDGACVGGGLECALACDYRVVTDNPKVKLGLPEVSLGIIPGWGGTQRLPQLISLPDSLKLILSGKLIKSSQAQKMGLVDRLIAHEFLSSNLNQHIEELVERGKRAPRQKRFKDHLLEGTPFGRHIIFKKSLESIERRTHGHYPAPLMALKVVKKTYKQFNRAHGLSIEAHAFGELCTGEISHNLIQLFYSNEALKKNAGIPDNVHPAPIKRAGVLGAGVMGGGIAWLMSSNGVQVRMKDLNWEAILVGLSEANEYNKQMVKRRRISKSAVNLNMHRISGTLNFSGFHDLDIVVEAVVENLEVKKKVLRELEMQIPKDAIIASNTSSFSTEELAADLKHPERFVGMHFFNPVNRMPLVEVIAESKTKQAAVARVVEFARSLGKTPIVVNNCSGFLVNRILIPYLNESAYMLQEGASMTLIDDLIEDFGMPMGPFALADEVGIDVGLKVAQSLEQSYGKRMRVADIMKEAYEGKHLIGKKSGKGFYLHSGKERQPNEKDVAQLRKTVQNKLNTPQYDLPKDQIIDRAILTMVNEAAHCIEEGIVEKPELLDMAMVMGTGFPAFRGGLLRYADERGISEVCQQLDKMYHVYGERYKPAELLLDMERNGTHFYTTN